MLEQQTATETIAKESQPALSVDTATNGVKDSTAPSSDMDVESNLVPRARLNEEIEKRRSMTKKMEKMDAKNEKARKEKMLEEGNLKELIMEQDTQLKAYKEKVEKWETHEANTRSDIMKDLSEQDKEIAESITDLRGLQKFYNRTKDEQRRVPTMAGTPSSNTSLEKPFNDMTPEEKKRNWPAILQSFKDKKQ